MIISASPAGKTDFAGSIDFGSKFTKTNGPYIYWWCDLVNTAAASADNRHPAKDAVAWLLEEPKKQTPKPTEPNEPPTVTSPNQP